MTKILYMIITLYTHDGSTGLTGAIAIPPDHWYSLYERYCNSVMLDNSVIFNDGNGFSLEIKYSCKIVYTEEQSNTAPNIEAKQ